MAVPVNFRGVPWSIVSLPMTRLNDYLRAERPDTTEPASFYVPGARSWEEVGSGRGKGGRPKAGWPGVGLPPADGGAADDPLDTNDGAEEVTAAQVVALKQKLDS